MRGSRSEFGRANEPTMSKDTAGTERDTEFGPFRLSPARRLIEMNGVPVAVGSRALDILILLVEREGEVVSKKELMARAWPDITVDEGSLRVHIAALRKALGDGEGGNQYIKNVPARGYCFVAPTSRPAPARKSHAITAARPDQPSRLPPQLRRMVGRTDAIREISDLLEAQRFVTVHGPGGIGKTATAVSVGHNLLVSFEGAVHFLDLGELGEPRLIPSALASLFNLSVQSSDPTPNLLAFLRSKRMLLILDNCEHLVEPVAALAERIFHEAPQVSILATSRETLQVEGEYVYRLPALECPSEGTEQSARHVLSFPAAHLFVERIIASGHHFYLTDNDAPIVAEICLKLDGIPLAIELAAARVGTYGLRETATLLDNRLRLLWHGRRTARPRHQTLTAALDWSYDLLHDLERKVLRRVSVFVGPFTLEAACDVASDELSDRSQVVDIFWQLVAKSLISAEASEVTTVYRLLGTTRTYALGKLIHHGEANEVAGRHARHCLAMLEAADAGDNVPRHPGNIRIALEWSLQEGHDTELGVALASASARVFVELSLFSECLYWTELALAAFDKTSLGARRELELQAALGLSLMLAKGHSERAMAALVRGLELAERIEDHQFQFRLLSHLHAYCRRAGHFHRLPEIAQRALTVAAQVNSPAMSGAANSLAGVSHHLVGNQIDARRHLETALGVPRTSAISPNNYELQFHVRTRVALARTLWLSGFPDQAVSAAREAAGDPMARAHPVTFCIVMIWGLSVFHWVGDLLNAESMIDQLTSHAEQHGLTTYLAAGNALKGRAMVMRGDIEPGIRLMRGSLDRLHANTYELYTTELNCALAQELAKSGLTEEALAVVDNDIAIAERSGYLLSIPELLRTRGQLLQNAAKEREAEDCFLRSLEVAGRQSAISWQLRTSIALARLRARQSRHDEARSVLREAYRRFDEGFDTADLVDAKRLLTELSDA
jgi:predicted ATPase/DNA-binding winged helix-turn-helix (wHTH) protein